MSPLSIARKQPTLFNRRLITVLVHGFASGLPIALVTSTLQAWFAVSSASILTIGALTLVGQPYAYKFLWAPLLDRYTLPFFSALKRRRSWIFPAQLVLSVTTFLYSFFTPITHPVIIIVIAFVTAFISATQDVAIDAYRTELMLAEERGLSVSLYTVGYRVAMLFSSGGALIIADHFGWAIMYQVMALLMLATSAVTLFMAPATPAEKVGNGTVVMTLRQAIIAPLRDFLKRPSMPAILAFVLFYKFTSVVTLSLISKFLLDLGFSLTTIGAVNKGAGLLATLLGTFCGGLLMVRITIWQALLWFGVLQALSNLTFACLAVVGNSIGVLMAAVFIDNFCGGLATVAFMSFLMSLCDIRYTATQYALLSSLASLGRIYFGPFAGMLAVSLHVATNHSHWAYFYIASCFAAIPSFALLYYLRYKSKVFSE